MGQKVEIYMTQQGARVVIPATQGENLAREYDFTVIGLDGQPVDMTGTTVVMYVLKGKDVVQVPATIAEDSAKIVLPSGACDVPGEHQCFIQIIKPDVFDLRVDNIILRVIPCDVDGAGEASSEFTLLTQLISEAEQAIENANTAAEEARTTAEETATTVATSTATNIINNQKGFNRQKGTRLYADPKREPDFFKLCFGGRKKREAFFPNYRKGAGAPRPSRMRTVDF